VSLLQNKEAQFKNQKATIQKMQKQIEYATVGFSGFLSPKIPFFFL
jgi:hypothetical protein